MNEQTTGPLAGIRVLEVGLLIQGPQAGALLADMGADVTKVELPGMGDQGRYVFIAPDDLRSSVFSACNRGKRGITLDLRHEAGAELFKRLCAGADVVISNFKPGTMDEWGLGFEHLKAVNPGLVWAAGSTFGPLGADAEREGADLAGQVAGGLAHTTGCDGDVPSPVGAFIADHIGSLNMVAGILAALHARQQSGRGQRVEVSLLGGQIWAQASEYTHYLMSGEVAGRSNFGHPLVRAVYRIFETADGWIGIIGVPPDAKDAFFATMGMPELSIDPRFESPFVAPEDLAWLKGQLETAFRARTSAQWQEALGAAGVRYAPVRDHAAAAEDQGAWENGYLQEVADHEGTMHRVVGVPIRMSDTPLQPSATAPGLGEHTDAFLREELGLGDEELAALRQAGTI